MGDMGKSIWAAARMPATLPLPGCRPSVLWESAGQFNHSSKEYALVETLYTRAKLLTCAVLDLEKFVQR